MKRITIISAFILLGMVAYAQPSFKKTALRQRVTISEMITNYSVVTFPYNTQTIGWINTTSEN